MNLVRMNLYRFVKAKSFYVILVITALLVSFLSIEMVYESEKVNNQEIIQQEVVNEDGEFESGMVIGDNFIKSASMMTGEFVSSGMILLFIAIFAVLFSNAERAGGYLKNLNSYAGTKEQIFIAKIVPVVIFAFLILWIIPFISVVSGMTWKDIFTKDFLIYMGVQWLLHSAYGIFMLMIMELSRSLVAGILIGILSGMGYCVTFIQFLENVVIKQEIISGHMLVTVARMTMPKNIADSLISALVTGAVSLIAYSVIGALMFKKRDIC